VQIERREGHRHFVVRPEQDAVHPPTLRFRIELVVQKLDVTPPGRSLHEARVIRVNRSLTIEQPRVEVASLLITGSNQQLKTVRRAMSAS
jgi:hypothetical protein